MTAIDGKIYIGIRTQTGGTVIVEEPDLPLRYLEPRHDMRNHSDAFEWGYAGSGPSQLAFAMIADASGDDEFAAEVYLRFKDEIIAPLSRDSDWSMKASRVMEFARALMPKSGEGEAA